MCALSCGDGFVSSLPTHPMASGRFSPILTHEGAGHVLRRIEPPLGFRDSGVDIYMARGYTAGGGSRVVTAVWFRVDVTKPHIDLRRAFARLRARAVAHAHDRRGVTQERGFVASGVYIESGLGILAGRGRRSVTVAGKARSMPYWRGGRDEDLLAEVMSGVASVVECADSRMASREHDSTLRRGHQYPRQRFHGEAFIKCHQVVVRACGGPNDPQGSDLHVDTMDGRGNAGGGWTVYAGERPANFDHLAVFASATGGNGFEVRVGGYGSDWACAVHLDTANRLHGSVWPSGAGGAPTLCGATVGSGLRIVMYTLRRIELLEESVKDAPNEEQTVIDASTDSVKRRMLGLQ